MSTAWVREERPDLAVDRILDAADRAFAHRGVSAVGMGEIAAEAGCSRGTLYRYFPNRHALHLAYVDRAASELVARVGEATAHLGDPRERLVEAILLSVSETRARPGMAAWFAAGDAGSAARMSRASEVVTRLSEAFVETLGPAPAAEEGALRARWIVRVILSLLAQPGDDADEERALVERFVVPTLLARP